MHFVLWQQADETLFQDHKNAQLWLVAPRFALNALFACKPTDGFPRLRISHRAGEATAAIHKEPDGVAFTFHERFRLLRKRDE